MGQRTWTSGAPLELLDLPTPEPTGRQVRVRVGAAGVNPVDWKMRSHGPLRALARVVGPRPPVVVGIDFAGVVDAVGPRVRGVGVGDRVVGGTNFARRQRGSYADTVIVHDDQVCRLPDSIGLAAAASLPVSGVTAQMAVVDLGGVAGTGDRVLVIGASGGVGQLATQIAKHRGAFVAGVCSARNVGLVTSRGVDRPIDYTRGDALGQATEFGPFRAVIDCAGGYSGAACRSLLTPGGRHVMVAGDDPGSALQVVRAPRRSRLILGRPTRSRLAPLVDLLAAGALTLPATRTMPLSAAEEAHRLSRSGRMTEKLVLLPDGAPPH